MPTNHALPILNAGPYQPDELAALYAGLPDHALESQWRALLVDAFHASIESGQPVRLGDLTRALQAVADRLMVRPDAAEPAAHYQQSAGEGKRFRELIKTLRTRGRPGADVPPGPAAQSQHRESAMGFEIFTPIQRVDSVKPGTASLNSAGRVRMTRTDCLRAGINGKVVILVDKRTRRIAMRPPHDDKGQLPEPAAKITPSKSGSTCEFSCKGALAEIGVPAEQVLGRHDLMFKDDLVILNFGIENQKSATSK